MKKNVLLIGAGEMGGVFARGFLKLGYAIHPVLREMSVENVANEVKEFEAIIVSVGEKDIDSVLESIPKKFQDKLILLQNELLPHSWKKHGIDDPTVISVWFEKKKGQDYKVLIPSPVYGPKSSLVKQALESIDIAVTELDDEQQLLFELIVKNVYILTTNIAGLEVGGTVGALISENSQLARSVAENVMDLQFKLVGQELDKEDIFNAMVNAFEGDMNHKCMGRSAPSRLERALKHADELDISVVSLRKIYENYKVE
ncbi:MAG: hypothetical protein KKD07_00620 [Candidatus Omnitrophica bacterium]|nr:hypothetical protein [Candidatus Omnitrophota bacterium]MBU1995827.1 hypothetical protein [Candidatus Omnitrophota bacterium]MBU4332926.1 hypothetical protein [Candidatus Omnitrophota bacterium]